MKMRIVFTLFLVTVFLSSLLPLSSGVNATTAITFSGEELLGRPTDSSITINIVPDSDIEYYYEYGTSPGVYETSTPFVSATGGEPHEIVINGLTPDTRYYYRMQYRQPGETGWIIRDEHTFHTQRIPGSTFTFTIISDSHMSGGGGDESLYIQTLNNVLADNPDFHFDLGDTFWTDAVTTVAATEQKYLAQRAWMSIISHSTPIYIATGNHENEEGWNIDDSPSKALLSINARKMYYPNPITDGFYSGNDDTLAGVDGDQLRENYFAWEWGDALFVVVDPFQYTMTKPYTGTAGGEDDDETVSNDRWDWTLGNEQYQWFKDTLEGSSATFKFVFAHHVTGGTYDYVRGGAEAAPYFEWGGKNLDDSWGFDTERPTWDVPIHQLMVDNNVSAFFHGHDHEYAYEELDGVVYQLVPAPSMTGYGFNLYSESDPFTIKVLPNSGHLRITVSPTQATVDYVATSDGTVNYSYNIPAVEEPTPPEFNIILGRPTDESVTANLITDESGEISFEYGTGPGVYGNQTSSVSCTADESVEVVIDGLTANTHYYYRVLYRAGSGDPWIPGDEHSFQTQRTPGESFTFDLISDSHLGQYGGQTADELALYEQTLLNVYQDNPDFYIDLGDTFPMDPSPLGTGMTEAEAEAAYLFQRPYMGLITHSVPLYLIIGNHENEEGWNWDDVFTPPDQSLALLSVKYRKMYYPNPVPDGFYTGNLNPLPDPIGGDTFHEDYYAWEWGDALFVVIEPFHYTMIWPSEGNSYGGEGQDGEVGGDRWDWTLGIEQYLWLKDTLENSDSTYKFVLSHHVAGGSTPYGRGGISAAPYFEWGGYNWDDTWGWDTERPAAEGWDVPIHQLMVNNGVDVFFHGHDHIYAYEELDGIVYLECPKPDDAGYAWEPYGYGYKEGLYPDGYLIQNSGHIRVNVTPASATVEYVRSYLPGDGTNGVVAHTFTIIPTIAEPVVTQTVTDAPNVVNPGDEIAMSAAVYTVPAMTKVEEAGLPILFNYVIYNLESATTDSGSTTIDTDAAGDAVLVLAAPMETSVVLIDAVFLGSGSLLASSNMEIISVLPILDARLTASATGGVITFYLEDQYGNPMEGQTLSFLTTAGALSISGGITDVNGEVVVALSDVESAVVSGSFGGYISPQVWAYQPTMTRITVMP